MAYEEIYTKPASGIPKTDLSSGVQTSLLPSQSGNEGKILTTDGSSASWTDKEVYIADTNSSTYDDVLAAYNAGKLIVCKVHGANIFIQLWEYIANCFSFYSSSIEYYENELNCTSLYVFLTREDGWEISTPHSEVIETTSNKVTAFQVVPDNTHYPSEKLVKDNLDLKANASTTYTKTEVDTALSGKVASNAAITGATKTKITYDSKGLVTAGTDLTESDIPNLSASKITSGTFADERIASASVWNAKSSKAISFTASLSSSGWVSNAQTISDARFIASGYQYIVAPLSTSYGDYASAMIYASEVSTDGQIVFHCSEVPSNNLTVTIVRIEVS